MEKGKNDRETCELNGFVVGDVIEGDEGYGPSRILITAIGQESLLARCLSHPGKPVCGHGESLWTLSYREWKKIDQVQEFLDEMAQK